MHGDGFETNRRSPVIKTRLVDLDAPVAGRMVDLHPGRNLFSGLLVMDHDVAGKQFRHARGVVLDDELLQLHGKRQLLQKNTVGLRKNGRVGLRSLCHQQIATESGVAIAETMLLGHISDHAAAVVRRFPVEKHLRPDDQVSVQQPAQTDQHNGAVCSNIAKLVGSPGLGRKHPPGASGSLAPLQLDLPASRSQQAAQTARSHFR